MPARRLWIGLAAAVALAGLVGGALALGGLERIVRHAPRDVANLVEGPVVAHRGFSAAAPENTMAAFRGALELGVAFELDVTLASTGEVVVIHDDTLDRTTSGSGAVRATPLDTLQELDAGSWFDPAFASERVPTLEQVLAQVGGRVVIDVELKTTPDRAALARGVVEVLRQADALGRVFVSSFDPYLLAEVRKLEPAIARAQLLSTFRGADMPLVRKVLLRNLALNGEAQPDMLVASDGLATRSWVRRQKARGYVVMVYTINDPRRMEELVAWGVDAVITDKPDLARETLAP